MPVDPVGSTGIWRGPSRSQRRGPKPVYSPRPSLGAGVFQIAPCCPAVLMSASKRSDMAPVADPTMMSETLDRPPQQEGRPVMSEATIVFMRPDHGRRMRLRWRNRDRQNTGDLPFVSGPEPNLVKEKAHGLRLLARRGNHEGDRHVELHNVRTQFDDL